MPQTQQLRIKNVSQLMVSFQLRTTAPFVIDRPTWQLEPQEEAAVAVTFDPAQK